jgi:hypothetical protein
MEFREGPVISTVEADLHTVDAKPARPGAAAQFDGRRLVEVADPA